jgi:hypothetical protein
MVAFILWLDPQIAIVANLGFPRGLQADQRGKRLIVIRCKFGQITRTE